MAPPILPIPDIDRGVWLGIALPPHITFVDVPAAPWPRLSCAGCGTTAHVESPSTELQRWESQDLLARFVVAHGRSRPGQRAITTTEMRAVRTR